MVVLQRTSNELKDQASAAKTVVVIHGHPKPLPLVNGAPEQMACQFGASESIMTSSAVKRKEKKITDGLTAMVIHAIEFGLVRIFNPRALLANHPPASVQSAAPECRCCLKFNTPCAKAMPSPRVMAAAS